MPGVRDVTPIADGLTARFGPVLDVEVLQESQALSKRYGPSDGRLFLVRPDGYVALKAGIEQAHLLRTHLERVLTARAAV
jgi:hypothetical protein